MPSSHSTMLSPRYFFFLLVGLLCLRPVAQRSETPASRDLFDVNMREVTPLQGLVRFASDNRVPIGIVVAHRKELCEQLKNVELNAARVEEVLDNLVPAPEYTWANESGVFVVAPRAMPQSSSFLLGLRFESFGSTNTTIQGLGAILTAHIQSLLRSGTGFALSILSSSNEEHVDSFTLKNVTVEQVANHIVSLGSKGLWILYPAPSDHQQIGKIQRLYAFSYVNDARTLSNLSCFNPQETVTGTRPSN